MHADIARHWKIEELASAVAMSRTTFTERFKAIVGLPPLNYLIRWRMAVAGAALRTGKSVSAIAKASATAQMSRSILRSSVQQVEAQDAIDQNRKKAEGQSDLL
jgi:methylphosphotriester-DNA--protein-cysteine methyltransferase